MAIVLICRTCGTRSGAALASNEQDLANVGMLERRCGKCASDTLWGLAQDYRKVNRRQGDRRRTMIIPPGAERRHAERRTGGERRAMQ